MNLLLALKISKKSALTFIKKSENLEGFFERWNPERNKNEKVFTGSKDFD